MLERGKVYTYKGKLYRILYIHEKSLSQNPLTGTWEPTVEYEAEATPDLKFFRTVTEFKHKFRER